MLMFVRRGLVTVVVQQFVHTFVVSFSGAAGAMMVSVAVVVVVLEAVVGVGMVVFS